MVTKTDIANAVEWDRDAALSAIRTIAPEATVLETSARTGVGVHALLDLLLDPETPRSHHPSNCRRRHDVGVCLAYVPDVQVSDYTIVHVGLALTKLDEVSALETLELFKSVGLLDEELGIKVDPL